MSSSRSASSASAPGRVRITHRLIAAHPLAATPGQVWTGRAQRRLQPAHLLGQAGVAERLVHQPGELCALLRGQRVQETLRRGRPPGQGVHQLLEIAGIVRKERPVLAHEVVELLLRVFTPRVSVEHVVERVHHLPDPRKIRWSGRLHGVAQSGELGVQHLAAQQVLDLLVLLPRLRRTPLVVGQGPHRP